jgi:exopolyphosphatase/pppGpp-phosphohydrolase
MRVQSLTTSVAFSRVARLCLALVLVAGATPAEARQAMCAIDMGSNTFRRIVGSFANGRYEQKAIDKQTLGVGDDVTKHGRISDAKLEEIRRTLTTFKASCDKDGVSTVVAIGTAAFRDAPNAPRIVELASTLGIAMEIATEARESELAYLVGSLGRDGYAVIDHGSRSIELVSTSGGALRHLVFDLGYRIAYDTFFARSSDAGGAVRAFQARLQTHVPKAPFMKGQTTLVGVEYGDMMAVLFDGASVEGRVLTLEALKERLQRVTSLPPAQFEALKKQKDIDRALPRLVTAVFLTEAFGYTRLELTDRELGVGLIIEAGVKRG